MTTTSNYVVAGAGNVATYATDPLTGGLALNGPSGDYANLLNFWTSVSIPATVTGWNPGLTLSVTYSIQAGAGGPNGTYYYYVTGVTAQGETACSPAKPANPIVTGGAVTSVTLLQVPTFTDSRVTSRNVYRSKNAVSDTFDVLSKAPQLVGTIANNTTTTFVDNVPDASLGLFAPFVDTTTSYFLSGTTYVGNVIGTANYLGIGGPSAKNLGYYCFGFGTNNLTANAGGVRNVALGGDCLQFNTTGSANVGVGIHAGAGNTTGNNNISIGYSAAQTNSSGSQNIAIGSSALSNDSGTGNNTAVGYFAGTGQTSGNQNTYVGYRAGANISTGLTNVFIGYGAGSNGSAAACTGNSNTVVGSNSGAQLTGIGSHNTLIGASAGAALQAAYYNVAVGEQAGGNSTTGTNNVWLGYYAGKYATASNEFYVNNQDRTNTAGDKSLSLMSGVFAATAAAQSLAVNAVLAPLITTVAGLPAAAAGNKGFKAMVTDALSATPAFCSTTVGQGGGSAVVPVFSDGTIWRFG